MLGLATGLCTFHVLCPSCTAADFSVHCMHLLDKIEEGSELYVNLFTRVRVTNEMCIWVGFVKYGLMMMDALRFQSRVE